MAEDSKRVVEQFYARLSDHDLTSIGELLAGDCAITVADRELDRDRYLEFLESFFTGFPDLRNTTEEVIAEGPAVAVRTTWHGTHRGAFLGGPPTGRSVTFGSFSTNRVVDGRIAERRILTNLLSLLHQIGDVSLTIPHSESERGPTVVSVEAATALMREPAGD